jgi:hypothetical protein
MPTQEVMVLATLLVAVAMVRPTIRSIWKKTTNHMNLRPRAKLGEARWRHGGTGMCFGSSEPQAGARWTL